MRSPSRQKSRGTLWLLVCALAIYGGLGATFAAEKTTAELREAIIKGQTRLENTVWNASGRLEVYEMPSQQLQNLTPAMIEAQWQEPSASLAPLRSQALFYRENGNKFRIDTAADVRELPNPQAAGGIFVCSSPKSFLVHNPGPGLPPQIEFSGNRLGSPRFINSDDEIAPVDALTAAGYGRVIALLDRPNVKLTETSTPLVPHAVLLQVSGDEPGIDIQFDVLLDADHDYAVRRYEVRTRIDGVQTTKVAFTTLRRLPDGQIVPEWLVRISDTQVPQYQTRRAPAASLTRLTFTSLAPLPEDVFALSAVVPQEVLANLAAYTVDYEDRRAQSGVSWSTLKAFIPVNESSGRGRNARTSWFVALGALAVMLTLLAVIRWRRWRAGRTASPS